MAEEKREKNAAEDELDAPARALIRQEEEVEVDLEAQRQIRRRTFFELATAFFVELVNGSAGVRSPVTYLLLLLGFMFMFITTIYEHFRESSFLASVKRVVYKDAKDDGKIN